jgi:glycine cleavage system H protein
VSGEIVEINSAVADDPSMLNRDPFEEGWLCRIRLDDGASLDELMDHSAYDQKYAS